MRLWRFFEAFRDRVYWHSLRKDFRAIGEDSFIEYPAVILGGKHISIGRNFRACARLRLEAFDKHLDNRYQPEITIGDNVSVNYDCHIGCVNRISIGNNVLLASRVFITDHMHGEITEDAIRTPPSQRKVTSRGPVVIEDNVWIGEGVAIMPDVRIGRDCIIGANAVVTKDVPPHCVAAGVPARVIRRLDESGR